MAQRVSTYMKNVGKSFGYALGDVFTDYNPVILSIGKEAKETATDMYDKIKSFSFQDQSLSEKSLKGQIKDSVSDIWNNFKDDIKTGNLYNKERQAKSDEAMMKAFGFDMDFDMDFDEDWGDDDSDSSNSAASIIEAEVNSTKQVISAVDQVGYKISASVSKTTAESADYIVSSANRSSRALYDLNMRGFNQISNSLVTINGTIASLAKIGEPLTTHMQNSALFFTNTTQKLEAIQQSLQQVVKNTTPAPLASGKKTSSVKGTFSSIFSDDMGIDISQYKDLVKGNFAEYKDIVDMVVGFAKKGKGEGKSYGANVSLAQMGLNKLVKTMLPEVFRESMKNFNESIKDALSGGLLKIREKHSSNILVELLKDMFLPQDGFKSNINTSSYEKGVVSWDGVSRKALTEVIPEALSLIYESMTGVSWVYNYDTGKFIFKESARKQQLEERQRYAREAGGQFRTSSLEKIDSNKSINKAQKEKMKQEIESYFFEAFMRGEGFSDIFENGFDYRRFGLTPESLKILQEVIQDNRKSKKFDIRHSHGRFVSDVQKTRDRYGNVIREREAQGNDVTITLDNGSMSISQSAKKNGININFGNVSSNKAASAVRGEKTKAEANTYNTQNITTENQIIDEDVAREKEREKRRKEAKKKVTGTYDKVKKFFSKDGFSEVYNRPFKAVADLLDKIGFSLEKLIWGGENDPEKGIMGYIFKKTDEVKDWFKRELMKKFGTDSLTDALFGKKDEFGDRQGGFFSDTINQTKENLSKAGKWLGRTTGQFFKTGKVKVDRAAYGRKVTKSGIVAVSEGELIIPSEYNPFYHGRTDKKQQVRNEANIVRNFYGSFAEGGTAGEEQGFFERFKQNAKEFGKMKKGSKVSYSTEGEGAGFKFIREGFETLGSGVSKVFHNMFGSGDEEQVKHDNKIIKTIAQKLMGEAKDNKGAMGAGALIGAGVSLATGAVVGPLFGAAIGAGAGLVINSKTVQRILFGDVIDKETGEVSGGLLSKNVSNFMKQKVPSIAKGGALGGIAGLFMGSPVMGALLGATTGYISSSEKAKTFIFGKVDEKGNEIERGIIPKELQDKVKKAAPNIAAGSIAGLFIGPFGLAGNLIVGGGLGYLTTSQKFHDWMFGNKETGEEGLTKIFKEKIFDNLDEIFHNMGNAISGWSKNLVKETSSRLKDFFTKRARAYENGEQQGLLGRVIGGSISLTGRAIKGTTNFVGDRLGGINRRLKASNLSRGYGVYDKGKKRNLFAGERVNARGGVGQGSGTFANFDELIANAGSVEELEQLRTQIQDAQDPNRIFRRNRNTALNHLYGSLQGLDPKKATKIAKMIEKGDPKSLNSIIKQLTPEEQAQYMPAINKALQEMGSAQQARAKANSIQSSLKGMGIDISKSGASNNAIDLINYELKNNKKFSPEELAKKKEEDWRDRVINIFKSMDINIARLVKKETGEASTAEADDNKVVEKTSIKDTLDKIDENTRTEIDAFGNVHQFSKNNQGEWEKVKNDSDTDESHAKMEKFMESVYHIPLIGKGIQSMTGFFGKIGTKLFGDKDDEDGGLLGKLFESSKGLLSFITGSKTGQTVKSILSSMSLKTVLGGIVAPALLAGGFGGKFDSIVSSIGNLPLFKGNDTKSAFDNNTSDSINGKTLAKDANGNYITNEKGEYQTTTGEFVSGNIKTSGSNTSFSAQLKKNLLTGIATGKGSVATATIKGAGKAWSKVLTKATGKEVVVNAASIGNGIMASIAKLLENIPKILKAIPFLPKSVADGAEDIVTTLYTYLDDAVKAASSKVLGKAASVLSNALIVLKVVTVVGAGIDAWGNAESILGITEEATTGQRIIATLIAVVNALIPVIGNLIPNKTLVNIFMKIAPKLGIDVSSLEEQRAAAAAELAQYNEANGTELSIEEYNQMNGKAGIITKAKNWGKSLFKNVKEQGVKKTLSNAWDGAKEGLAKAKDSLVGAAKAVDKVTGISTLAKLAASGDIKGLLTYSTADEDDNTFTKILKQVPMIFNKISMMPMALGAFVGKGIKNKIESMINSVKKGFDTFKDQAAYGTKLINSEDSDFADFFKVEEDPENPMGEIQKAFIIGSRLTAIPTTIVRKLGRGIKNEFDKMTTSVKTTFSNIMKSEQEQIKLTLKGDVQGLIAYNPTDNEDNPVSGITKAISIGGKFVRIIPASVSWVGHKVADGISDLAGKAKTTISNISKNEMELSKYVLKGDISGLINHEITDGEDNPISGITKGILIGSKFVKIIPTAISWVGHKIADWFMNKVEISKSNYSTLSTSLDALRSLRDEGKVSEIWNYKLQLEKGDMLHKVYSFTFSINQITNIIGAVFNNIIDKATDFLGGLGEKVSSITNKAKETVQSITGSIGEWAEEKFDSFKEWVSGGGSGQGSFISQLDPKYKDMKFGDYTVGEKGCAPAVASMVANAYGKKLSMQDAVSASSGFQNKEGTSADYFQKVLNSRGINTNYMSGQNIPGQILQTLANGEQVIILGKDAHNQSKKNSPFGPNGHYVVATGIDRNGNIIINDPESNQPRVYDKKILTNARIGISTHASGSGTSSYDTETAKKVWGYFTSNGYTPAATAGIMGNLYSESKMNPAVIQSNGKGPAAGIAQWENYNTKSARWKGLYDYATARGYQWNELTPQLEFINHEMSGLESYFGKAKNISGYSIPATTVSAFKTSTDPQMAALQFEKAFERAGTPRMETRLAAAKEYYNLYHDSSYTGSYSPDAPNPNAVGMMSSGISAAESTSQEPVTFSTILSAIGTVFSNAFGAVLGRNNSADSISTTTYTGSQSYAATPIDFSNVPEGKGNALQKKIVQYANSRVGKNQYTQGPNRTKVDQGYSDCSSFAQWAYKQALGIDPGGYTGAQIQSPLLTTVDAGTTPNKDRLEAGDLLFFRSKTNNGRYKNVGHVEIYDGNGNVIGHGSGIGPKVRNLDEYVKSRESYGGPYIEARRYTDIANASGGSSGLLLRSNPGAKLYGKATTLSIPRNRRVAKQFSGGGTTMVAETKNMLNNLRSDVVSRGKSGSISAELVEKLLEAIIGILKTISTNTDSVDKIYQLLSVYMGNGKTPSPSTSSQTSSTSNNDKIMSEVDVNIRSLVGTLAAIAKG